MFTTLTKTAGYTLSGLFLKPANYFDIVLRWHDIVREFFEQYIVLSWKCARKSLGLRFHPLPPSVTRDTYMYLWHCRVAIFYFRCVLVPLHRKIMSRFDNDNNNNQISSRARFIMYGRALWRYCCCKNVLSYRIAQTAILSLCYYRRYYMAVYFYIFHSAKGCSDPSS